MLMKMIEMAASMRLLIIFLSMALALASCDDELCGSIPNFSAISLWEYPSITAIWNTLP